MRSFDEDQNDKLYSMFRKFDSYYPDFVIQFKNIYLPPNTKSQKALKKYQKQISRINFYLNLLISSKFVVTIAKSQDNQLLYVMLILPEEQLDIQCQNLKMKLKMMTSYVQDEYDTKSKVVLLI